MTGVNRSPSSDLATITATPRPSLSGRRSRQVSQNTPSTSTAEAAPAQLPGPEPGAGTTTVAPSYDGSGTCVLVTMTP